MPRNKASIMMMPHCTSCGKEMDFVEGDMIYGENWYHRQCWKVQHGDKTNA